jgi:uncharacterized membrane protein
MDFGQLLATLIPTSGGLLVIRAIVGIVLVFFLPGFAWTLVFFKKINIIERIALSVGLSVALVTLSVIVFNVVLNISINGLNALIIIIVITIIPLAIYFLRKYLGRRPEATDGD